MPRPRLRRPLAGLILLAVVLRLAALAWTVTAHPELLHPAPQAHGGAHAPRLSTLGFEASNIAEALVCRGRGFADPFGVPTGPTAWISPGVVGLYATAFALFGCFTPGSALFLYAVALALSAALVGLAAAAAARLFGDRRSILAAALLMALSPYDLALFATPSAFDLNLHAFFLLLLVVLLLGLRHRAPPSALAAFAAVAAAATLFNPVMAAVAAGGLAVALWGRPWRRGLAAAGLLLAAGAVLVGPYVLYQRLALGAWVPVKSNAPFELYLGNLPAAAGVPDGPVFRRHHPSQSAEELAEYRRLGEAAYVRSKRRRFLEEVSPARYARDTLRRAGHFFVGTGPTGFSRSTLKASLEGPLYALVGVVLVLYPALRRLRPEARGLPLLGRGEAVVYAAVAVYAAPYVLTSAMRRYVLPVTPLVLLLAAGAAVAAWNALAALRSRR